MSKIPKISDAEWEVMQVLWRRSPLTANDVIDSLAEHKDWSPKTIRTLLRRLVEKGAVAVDHSHKLNSYYPIVSEEECVRAETRSLLNRLYGGAMKPFLVNFLKEEPLSRDDIEELKRILDEKSKT